MASNNTPSDKKPVAKKYPLFMVNFGGGRALWIVEKSQSSALSRAHALLKKRKEAPSTSVTIEQRGTVDFIPQILKAHWEV